jgi:signal transduction histidine kinase
MYSNADGYCFGAGPDQIEICLGVEPETRYYLLETSELEDWRGMAIGHLLLLCDVTEHKLAQVQAVKQQRAQAMLQEREQLARELHDCLGQVFAFVNVQGQTIQRLMNRGDIETAHEYIGRMVDVTREADVDIRESILSLRVTLSEHGFFPALTLFLIRYEKNYNIHILLEVPEAFADRAFEPLVEVQLLRILQEALTNVRKHASARCVRIAFAVENDCERSPCAHSPCARITIQDDGQGFDPGGGFAGTGEHVGLRVMRERVEELGGNLSLYSKPGQGTEVVVRVPLKVDRYGEKGIRRPAEVENG